jgi:O-antigen ligase
MLGMGAFSIFLYQTNSPFQYYFLNNGSRGLFSAWVAVFAYALALFNDHLDKRIRLLLLILVGLLVFRYFIKGQSWVSGWLPLGIGCAVLTLLRSRRLFLLCLVLGSIYLAFNFNEYYTDIVLGEESEGSGTGRMELWEMNLNHVKNHLLFGMGPAGYAVYNMSYHPEDARSTHNNYFDVLAQTGVVGSLAFLWLVSAFLRTCYQTRQRLVGKRDFAEAFANATFAGCISMLVAMMLGDWVLPFAYNQTITGFDNACYTWIFMGGAVALWRITQNQLALQTN